MKSGNMHQTIKPASTMFALRAGKLRLIDLPAVLWRPVVWLGIALIISALCGNAYAAQTKTAPIVVTIKPLYSLVANLTEGLESPVLLMQQMQSPHHYNMKPSERRLLAEARLIFWLGPQLESYLDKVIRQQNTATVVTAIHAQELDFLRLRHKHIAEHPHTQTRNEQLADREVDPHIWLSTHNAIAISKQITAALIKDSPENATIYKKNLQHLLEKIEQTKTFVHSTLQSDKQPYLVYHDAFQYFEQENGLNYIDSVTFDEETAASLKHVREINKLIKTLNIQCLVYQPPEPAIVRSLAEHNPIKAVALDPLGMKTKSNKDAWFEIMRQLALDFHQCLNPVR